MKSKLTLLLSLWLYLGNVAMAQSNSLVFKAKKLGEKTKFQQNLAKQFADYQLFELPIEPISTLLNQQEKSTQLVLQFPDSYEFRLQLYPTQLFGEKYKLRVVTSQGIVQETPSKISTYEGYHNNQIAQIARLTVAKNFLAGFIMDNDTEVFLEPLQHFFPKAAAKNQYILYRAKDVLPTPNATCIAIALEKAKSKGIKKHSKAAEECAEVEVASAYDLGMFERYGSVEATINRGTSIMNLLAENFVNKFNVDIGFVIVENLVVTSTDPWTDTVDGKDLLSEFREWGQAGNFQNTYDMAQLWTARNFNGGSPDFSFGTVGLAYVGVLCGIFRYQLLEDFSNNLQSMRVMVAHETGHNFGASHDESGAPFIMAPSVNPNLVAWSENSTNSINTHLASRNCLDVCGCNLTVTNLETSNCNTATETYDLVLTLTHKSGSESGFTVTLDGQAYPQSYSLSPQTLTISNLPSKTTLASLSITDNELADCSFQTTYQPAHPNCVCSTIHSENFDNCTLPTGWSTQGIGINTEATWQFGIPEGNSELGGSIDGTCLAYFDDDAYDGIGFNGDGGEIVTLTSPVVDLTNFDNATLQFEYNFRQWENSYFQVEVWDGNSWQEVLLVNEEACGNWNCDFPKAIISVGSYVNEQFQVKFTFHDDDTWAWYVALDNFELCGFPNTPICDATFQYPNSTYTIGLDNNPTPIITGDTHGIFTVTPTGLIIDSQTGTIDLANSEDNTYTIIYTSPNNCSSTTTVTLSSLGVALNINVWLEGAATTSENMGTQLRLGNLIPAAQPYSVSPWNYEGAAYFSNILTILPTAVDWILVELRNADNVNQIVATKVGLLLNDGNIVDWQTIEHLQFENVVANKTYYIVVRHRNHLDIMSKNPVFLTKEGTTYDFTTSANQAFGNNQMKLLSNGKMAMLAGDVNGDGSIIISDLNAVYLKAAALDAYTEADLNLDKSVTVTDLNLFGINSGTIGIEAIRYE